MDGALQLLGGQDAAANSMWVIENRPEPYPYDTLASLEYFLAHPIPRVIWDDKPLGLGTVMVKQSMETGVGEGFSLGPGLIGHIVNDNPWIALPLYAILLGAWLRILDDLLVRFAYQPYLVLPLGIELGEIMGLPRGELGFFAFRAIAGMAFAYFWHEDARQTLAAPWAFLFLHVCKRRPRTLAGRPRSARGGSSRVGAAAAQRPRAAPLQEYTPAPMKADANFSTDFEAAEMHRRTHGDAWAQRLVTLGLSVILAIGLVLFYNARRAIPDEVGLGKAVQIKPGVWNGSPINAHLLVNYAKTFPPPQKEGDDRLWIWLGNSQLHAINQLQQNDEIAPVLASRTMGFPVFGLSLANASVREHYVVTTWALSRSKPQWIILPVVFDKMRNYDLRTGFRALLDDATRKELESNPTGAP